MGSAVKTRGAVIVTRVSTGEQAKHGTSLESQLDACRSRALALNLPIVAEYQDAGVSGGYLLLREGMQRAIADIKAGRSDTLICANISRYSRDVEHQWKIKREVEAAGGRIVFCDMQIDDTPEGDLFFGISGSFAQYERELIRSRTMKGRAKRIEDGQQPSRAHSPYGYHIVTHADVTRGTFTAAELGRYVIQNDEAESIRYLFEAYASGAETMASLCRRLYERGAKPRRAKLWRNATLAAIFSNPVYKGEPAVGRYRYLSDETRVGQFGRNCRPIKTPRILATRDESEWTTLSAPAIVSTETWDAVQARMQENNRKLGGNPRRTYLLSGLAVCPQCGCKMVVTGKPASQSTPAERRYYLCSAYNNAALWAGETRCKRQSFPIAKVEAAVVLAILDAAKNPEALDAAEDAYRDQRAPQNVDSLRQELRAVDRSLEELRETEQATVMAQVAGIRAGGSPEAYSSAFADIAVQRKDLEDRRGLLAGMIRQAEKPRAIRGSDWRGRALGDAKLVLESEEAGKEEKRRLIRTVVNKVVCKPDGADVYFGCETVKNISVTQNSPV